MAKMHEGEFKRGGKVEKRHEGKREHEKRAMGGRMPRTHDDEMREHVEEEPKRKRGGKVEGKKAEHRPDRRARGGGITAGPTSEAGKVKEPAFVKRNPAADDTNAGEGNDRG